MSLGNDPDRELVDDCLCGVSERIEQGFARIYEKYQARIYNLGLRITGDHSAARDVVQETFSTVFQKMQSFRGQSLFSSWLTRIGINYALERRRKDARTVALPSSRGSSSDDDRPGGDETDLADPKASSPDRATIEREMESEVQGIIHALSPKYQTVILLRYVEGLPYEEIAEALSCSVGTVKSRLNRAHRLLEGSLSGLAERFGFLSTENREGPSHSE